jgi:hypothetical protein
MKFEHKDILILGDSFCSNRDSDSDWPFIVSQKLSNSFERTRGRGFGGASWWSVRKKLLKELEISVPKVLILCHTEPNRIPNDRGAAINGSVIEAKTISYYGKHLDHASQQRIIKAAKLYYEELWSHDYYKWAQIAWFKELDELLNVWEIPYIIHLRCFKSTTDYIFKNGITIKEPLITLADYENQKVSIDDLNNHFTEDVNKKLGNRLVELLLNYQPGLQEL